ncbi:MAG TPA: hypothetical protein PLB25_14390 [Rhodoferax sp.]|nr:hypothetical protein [Rhodoferax sp.]
MNSHTACAFGERRYQAWSEQVNTRYGGCVQKVFVANLPKGAQIRKLFVPIGVDCRPPCGTRL